MYIWHSFKHRLLFGHNQHTKVGQAWEIPHTANYDHFMERIRTNNTYLSQSVSQSVQLTCALSNRFHLTTNNTPGKTLQYFLTCADLCNISVDIKRELLSTDLLKIN